MVFVSTRQECSDICRWDPTINSLAIFKIRLPWSHLDQLEMPHQQNKCWTPLRCKRNHHFTRSVLCTFLAIFLSKPSVRYLSLFYSNYINIFFMAHLNNNLEASVHLHQNHLQIYYFIKCHLFQRES